MPNYDFSKGMPQGENYEDKYNQYLNVFQAVAECSVPIEVMNAPFCWHPLLRYLGANVLGGMEYFEHCYLVSPLPTIKDRTALEALCSLRPECVDALYKADMEWNTNLPERSKYEDKKEFIITTTSAFQRKEIKDYMVKLSAYQPKKGKVCLVPCSADKPYPSELHKKIKEMLPDDYYIATCTGALGIVPEELWEVMPEYDAGIPNLWNIFITLRGYFSKHFHEEVIIYSDFNNEAIELSLNATGTKYVSCFSGVDKYLPLEEAEYQSVLVEALGLYEEKGEE